MFMQFPVVIVLLLWAKNPLAYSQYLGAKPGCDMICGAVGIPYPFGMKDPNCYADKWFEIECKNISQNPKPILKSLNLEVQTIDEDMSIIKVSNPIYRWNCGAKAALPAIDLKGSPFVYSKDQNQFLAIGCNNLALLVSNGSEVGGCVSICDGNDQADVELVSDSCHGRYCCETALPMYLSEYNVTFEVLRNNSEGDECKLAMVVDRDWIYYVPYDIKNLSYVPAVLDWEILNWTVQLPNANCYKTNVTSSNKIHSGRRCKCGIKLYGNAYIDGGCRALPGHSDSNIEVIIGVIFSVLGPIVLVIGLWRLCKIAKKRRIKNRRKKFFKQNGGLLLQQRLASDEANVEKTKLFTLKDLEKATDRFNTNRVLGKGGQGTVYKGMLVDGKIVAVKKFKVQGNAEEFINEFVILSQINHRNVVKLLGCCLETEVPLLVYEFIPNGTLFQNLHEQNEDLLMNWEMRLRIATEVAGALSYLHSAASQPIYHRDIKSTNILLDEKFRAKVADFGTSRMVSIEDTHLTTLIQGTFGYLDPEYFHTSQFTEKSDVYSFGVVLAELLTGQRPISSTKSEEEEVKSLASYFTMCMEENCVLDIVDKRVINERDEHIMAVANVAKRCLNLNGRKRPTMKEVTMELETIQKLAKKSNNSHQDYEEIKRVGVEAFQPWSVFDSTSIEQTQKSITSSSSEVVPFVYFE